MKFCLCSPSAADGGSQLTDEGGLREKKKLCAFCASPPTDDQPIPRPRLCGQRVVSKERSCRSICQIIDKAPQKEVGGGGRVEKLKDVETTSIRWVLEEVVELVSSCSQGMDESFSFPNRYKRNPKSCFIVHRKSEAINYTIGLFHLPR